MEIACDESGHEGEKLAGGVTDVFAHASVHLPAADAQACVAELRRRIRSPAQEYKANHLLRDKHRTALVWFLGPAGPLPGRARVVLVHKELLLVRRLAATLAPGWDADALHTAGRAADPAAWEGFLLAANALLRGAGADLAAAAGRLRVDGAAAVLLARLAAAPPPAARVALDPLVPAIATAVARWGASSVVHDRQTVLGDARLARLRAETGATVRLVASRSDARVQVADFVAGTARRIASDALAGRGDAELVALVAPYVDPGSVWLSPVARP
jgi:hypothetical protein